ncbi:trypsin-like peptidase domain-containing protein [Streptomyces sp. 796.1]|uniref:trypsin-like peptidase domain-containing protein n=1 Tax=Streptomyces sp. 796.1 TaxID=3163029 RepID=UPI0039C8E2CB
MHDLPDRAVEVVRISRPDGTVLYGGSGFLLTGELVLTARHVVDDATCAYRVLRPAPGRGSASADVELVVPAPAQDLALLVLDEAVDALAPLRFGRLPSAVGTLPFHAMGFPRFAREDGRSRRRQATGTIQLASQPDVDGLDLWHESVQPTAVAGAGSPWEGFSGAAVLARRGTGPDAPHLVVGVYTTHLTPAGTRSAVATRVDSLADTGKFARYLRAHEVNPEPVDVPLPGGAPRALPSNVRTHESVLAGLRGTKSYLLPEHLEFVSPGPHSEAAPQRLLDRLTGPERGRGVLLVGAAGTGKTRTCFEVAQAAHDAGWYVLHVRTDRQRSLTVSHLEQAVFDAGQSRVLLVLDYLDTCAQLDLGALADEFMLGAAERGIQVACVASTRPGTLPVLRKRGVRQLFDEVTLRQDSGHQSAVIDAMLPRVAPTALDRMKHPTLRQACGNRPIIALLVAAQIERRFVARQDIPRLSGWRSDDLLAWLDPRLQEDRLRSPEAPDGDGDQDATPRPPSDRQLAATVAAYACPQPRDAVVAAVDAFLTDRGSGFDGDYIVRTLTELGWLEEPHEDQLMVVHDIVTDELVRQLLLPAGPVHLDSVRDVFTTSLITARTFGGFAGHLARLAADLDDAQNRQVARVGGDWLRSQAARVGALLKRAGDEGRQALLTLLSRRPWQGAADGVWDEVAQPWLVREKDSPAARALLAQAVESATATVPEHLVEAALAWLYRGGPEAETSHHVIHALLERHDLPAGYEERVVDYALAWLALWKRHRAARFVLGALLRRDRALTGQRLSTAAYYAFSWLHAHHTTDASHVLHRLLSRADVEPGAARRTIVAALGWLGHGHAAQRAASLVLAPLVAHPQLTRAQRKQTAGLALTWLGHNEAEPVARFVLHALLRRTDLAELRAGRAVDQAAAWLQHGHAEYLSAAQVFGPLLPHPALTGEQRSEVVRLAWEWVCRYDESPAAGFVLSPLLTGADLGPRASELAERALAWVQAHPQAPNAAEVLVALLAGECAGSAEREGGESGERLRRTVDFALNWLESYGADAVSAAVHRAALRSRGLRRDQARRAADATLNWLKAHALAADGGADEASGGGRNSGPGGRGEDSPTGGRASGAEPGADGTDGTDGTAGAGRSAAADVEAAHAESGTSTGADAGTGGGAGPGGHAGAGARADTDVGAEAIAGAEANAGGAAGGDGAADADAPADGVDEGPADEVGPTLGLLLSTPELRPAQEARALDHAVEWLARPQRHRDRGFLWLRVLRTRGWVGGSRGWPQGNGGLAPPGLSDLAALLGLDDLTAPEVHNLAERTLAHCTAPDAAERTVRAAVAAVLDQPQLTARQEETAAALASRLVAEGAETGAGTAPEPLPALLGRALPEPAYAQATALGFRWLARCERAAEAPRVLFALADRHDLTDDRRRALNVHALNWYAVNSERPWAPEVRAFLTAHGDDEFGDWLRSVEDTRAWLLANPDDPERGAVLLRLLTRPDQRHREAPKPSHAHAGASPAHLADDASPELDPSPAATAHAAGEPDAVRGAGGAADGAGGGPSASARVDSGPPAAACVASPDADPLDPRLMLAAVHAALTSVLSWRDFVALLENEELLPEQRRAVAGQALAYLRSDEVVKARLVIIALLRTPELTPEQLWDAAEEALALLTRTSGRTFKTRPVLLALLRNRHLSDEHEQAAIERALRQAEGAESNEAKPLLRLVLTKQLTPEQSARAISYSLDWLLGREPVGGVGSLLAELLERSDCTPDQWQLALGYARDWLTANPAHTVTERIATRLAAVTAQQPATAPAPPPTVPAPAPAPHPATTEPDAPTPATG